MKQILLSTILMLSVVIPASAQVSEPKEMPQLEFALQLKVTLGEAYTCGETQPTLATLLDNGRLARTII